MNISIILANPDRKSFNHAIAETAFLLLRGNSHNVIFHDLYRENFNRFSGLIPRSLLREKYRLEVVDTP